MWLAHIAALFLLAITLGGLLWIFRRQAVIMWTLDALVWWRDTYRGIAMWASALLTVRWDPLGRSLAPIAVSGVLPYTSVSVVVSAPGGWRNHIIKAGSDENSSDENGSDENGSDENGAIRRAQRVVDWRRYIPKNGVAVRAQRIVAWFYRWHDTPTESDWSACLARFGLSAVPDFVLRLHNPEDPDSRALIVVTGVSLGDRRARPPQRGCRTASTLGGASVSGVTPMGGLGLAQIILDLQGAMPAAD
jgi:hypothetical protein